MSGEQSLVELLRHLTPVMLEEDYVFCTLPAGADFAHLQPVGMFSEQEGVSLIVPRSNAEQQRLPFDGVFRCITLTVHSSLAAVGLTAAVSTALADAGIPANVVAGYYHDHLFVPAADADEALRVLTALAAA